MVIKIKAGQTEHNISRIEVITMLVMALMIRPTYCTYISSLRTAFTLISLLFAVITIVLCTIENIKNYTISYTTIIVFMWQAVIVFSTLFNGENNASAVTNALQKIALFQFVELQARRSYKDLMKGLFNIISIYCAVDVLLMIWTGKNGVFPELNYLTGTPLYFMNGKFDTSYLQVLWSMLLVYHEKNRRMFKLKCAAAIVINLIVCSYVRCTTGILMSCIFWLVVLIPAIREFFLKPKRFVVFFIVANFLIVVAKITLNKSNLMAWISMVLGKSVTLTGRTDIYSMFFDVIKDNWILGYGMGNNRIYEFSGGSYANMQNAFLQSIVMSGIIGTALLTIVILRNLKRIGSKETIAILAAMVSFFFAAIIEIVFDSILFIIILAIGCYVPQNEKVGER